MSKKVIILFGVVFCMLSCTKEKNDIVKDEFYKYVSQNFDDPNDLKEIVSIEQVDTISYESFFKAIRLLYGCSEQIDSLGSKEQTQTDSIINYLRNQYPTDDYGKRVVREWIAQSLNLNNDQINWNNIYYDETNFLKIEIDSLLENLKGLLLYEYEIKARINDGTDLKLKKYYALEDSITIRFFDKKPTFSDYSEDASEIYKAAKKYEEIYDINHDIIIKKLELNKKIIPVLK